MSKFVVRRATLADIPEIVDLAVESVSLSPLPVVIDRERMAACARECVAGNQHFVHVAAENGKVVACVGAQTSDGWWFQRGQSSVLLFYTRVPGAGIALLREYARWVRSRAFIKMAIFSLEHDADPRIALLLRRLGFRLENPQLTYVRGM